MFSLGLSTREETLKPPWPEVDTRCHDRYGCTEVHNAQEEETNRGIKEKNQDSLAWQWNC